MPLYYVTGVSGSGKSTVRRELKARGYKAPGVDEEGYGNWVDRTTGEVVPYPHDDKNLDFHDWYKRHEWEISLEKIMPLKEQAEREHIPIFLCGAASGDSKAWHLFDKVIALVVDADTLEHRIRTRAENDYGKTPEELALILKWHGKFNEDYHKFGAEIIDATRPLDEVVDAILRAAGVGPAQ